MAALCKAPTKSAGIGLSITAVCKNAEKKTLGQDDFFCSGSLSPFLFTMATDVLSRLILQKEFDGLLKGIKVARNCPSISHLMFANDLIIFSRALSLDIEAIQDCLNQFHKWSVLLVNTTKFAISFNTNIQ